MSTVTTEKKKRSRKLPKTITEKQALEILGGINRKTISGCRHYAIIMTMYRSGLRVSEICNLTPADVNFETEMLFLQNAKGGKDRYVPIDEDTKVALESWNDIRPESRWFFCAYSHGKVGNQMSTRQVREMCYRTSENAHVYIQDGTEKKKVSPHKFRHTFATEILNNSNFNLVELKDLLGHSSIATTQVYTHVAMEEVKKKFQNRKPLAS